MKQKVPKQSPPYIDGVEASDEWYLCQSIFQICWKRNLLKLGKFDLFYDNKLEQGESYYLSFYYEGYFIAGFQYQTYTKFFYDIERCDKGDWLEEISKYYKLELSKIDYEKDLKKKVLDSYWDADKNKLITKT